jgi:hypothetical protein
VGFFLRFEKAKTLARLFQQFHALDRVVALEEFLVPAAIEQRLQEGQFTVGPYACAILNALLLVFLHQERGDGAQVCAAERFR